MGAVPAADITPVTFCNSVQSVARRAEVGKSDVT